MFNTKFPSQLPETLNGTAGESLAVYTLCYLKSDGKYYPADADAASTMPGIVLSLESIAPNGRGRFLRRGQVTNAGWAWGTVGGFLYAQEATTGTAGLMTQTAPSGHGDQVQIAGIALGATTIDFQPNLLIVEVA